MLVIWMDDDHLLDLLDTVKPAAFLASIALPKVSQAIPPLLTEIGHFFKKCTLSMGSTNIVKADLHFLHDISLLSDGSCPGASESRFLSSCYLQAHDSILLKSLAGQGEGASHEGPQA